MLATLTRFVRRVAAKFGILMMPAHLAHGRRVVFFNPLRFTADWRGDTCCDLYYSPLGAGATCAYRATVGPQGEIRSAATRICCRVSVNGRRVLTLESNLGQLVVCDHVPG